MCQKCLQGSEDPKTSLLLKEADQGYNRVAAAKVNASAGEDPAVATWRQFWHRCVDSSWAPCCCSGLWVHLHCPSLLRTAGSVHPGVSGMATHHAGRVRGVALPAEGDGPQCRHWIPASSPVVPVVLSHFQLCKAVSQPSKICCALPPYACCFALLLMPLERHATLLFQRGPARMPCAKTLGLRGIMLCQNVR